MCRSIQPLHNYEPPVRSQVRSPARAHDPLGRRDALPASSWHPDGWLVLYHGAHTTASGPIYRVGFALLDLERPETVLRRSDTWVLGPQADYERVGDVNKVVFPNGWVVDEETGILSLYYGAADSAVSLATASFSDVLEYVRHAPQPRHRRVSD